MTPAIKQGDLAMKVAAIGPLVNTARVSRLSALLMVLPSSESRPVMCCGSDADIAAEAAGRDHQHQRDDPG